MSTDPIRTAPYEEYMQARERQVTKEILAENEKLRELCHRLTFEVENLKHVEVKYGSALDTILAMDKANSIMADDLSRLQARCDSLTERVAVQAMGYEQMEEVLQTCPDRR